MIKRKMVSVLLITALILSNISFSYGMETQPDTDVYNTTEEAIGDDETISGDSETSSGSSIDEGTVTDGAVENVPVTTEPSVTAPNASPMENGTTVKAAAQNYFVQTMGGTGALSKVGTGYETISSANTAMNSNYSSTKNKGLVVTDKNNKIINMKSGIGYFKKSSATANIGNTYITPKDALHFVKGDGKSATLAISGAEASADVDDLILVPETLISKDFYKRDYYTKKSNGDLEHRVYKIANPATSYPYKQGTGKSNDGGVFVVDKAPSWMSIGGQYYSPDGITFYSDSAMTIKVGSPHYSYYKYLPYRSMSVYTPAQLNSWISYKTGSVSPTSKASKLISQGRNLVNAQNRYGINAVSELAFACLESAYGKSSFALTRNNLFGINAVDSNPGQANSFSSVASCINRHAEYHLSRGYGDAKTDHRYFGLAPGNKGVGVNVKYASDPWHGEKISGIAYSIDKYLGSKDYRKFTVGVTNKDSVGVYKNAGSTLMYNFSTKSAGQGPSGIPVIILGSSGSYYMIQSDLPVSGNDAKYSYTYYYSNSVAYVKKTDITIANSGSRNYTTEISRNNLLRNMTVKVGSKDYLSAFDPYNSSYSITVPGNTKTVVIDGSALMGTGTVSGNGTKTIKKSVTTYNINVKSKSGSTRTYKVKVTRNGNPSSQFTFGVYNTKTKLSNKSKKGKRTTAKRPMKIQTKIKTNKNRTTVKMVIYNKNKKVVASKVQYIYKTKTVKFSWNGKYTKHNKLKKKAGGYAPYSKKGTKYYVKFIVSRKGTKTNNGKYHPFYLYK